MLFSSYPFIFIFLPIVLAGYFAANRLAPEGSVGKWWLLAASLVFYGYWYPPYLLLILGSVGANFFLARELVKEGQGEKLRRLIFLLGIGLNLGLLGYFKYRDFFLENLNLLVGSDWHFARLALPLGISFFTLQQVAFLVDTYQGITRQKKFLDYSLFVCFFPQLIAGPIVHYKDVIPQFEDRNNARFNLDNFTRGLYVFILGLMKKVIIADTFAGWATEGFDHSPSLHLFAAWGTSLSYTLQLYFDFSGYSDMALGLGAMFNIRLPQNFNSPFKARNVIDFWNRWHITLSQFITTYVFTPLFRSFKHLSFRNSLVSVFLTMMVAGIWHGAGWTFVVYGAMYGAALVVNHTMKKRKWKLATPLAIFLTFNFTNVVFTMFRAHTIDDALKVYRGMLGLSGVVFPKGIVSRELITSMGLTLGQHMSNDANLNLAFLALGLVVVFKAKNSLELMKDFEPRTSHAFSMALMLVMSLFGLNRISEFIYFNF
jgi:D-alanyl-lipoteichoic acid acyltransferase DltB (MBOAT superfamily)